MKSKIIKAATATTGAGLAIYLLFTLIQDMRSEINDLRERIAVVETKLGDINE